MPRDENGGSLRNEVSEDEEIQTTFQRLRRDGHSRLEAVQMILDALDVSLSEAKRLLVNNDTWAEARSAAGLQSESEEDTGGPSSDDPDDNSMPPAPG